MKAVLMKEYGGTDVLYLGETKAPNMKENELLIDVRATALNRADLLQRRGLYPAPEGASRILGLEVAGVVADIGANVSGWEKGDRIMALLPGGGYAEKAVVPASMAMRIPDGLSFTDATAIPEAFLTAYLNLVWLGRFQPGMNVLVHAGGSGVGTAAIQIIQRMNGQALVTAGSQQKLALCIELGAAASWNYHQGSFVDFVLEHTDGTGVDMIIDFIGAPYFADNMKSLGYSGKLVIVGVMGGAKVDQFSLMDLMSRQLTITGTTLRSQPLADKIRLVGEFAERVLPHFDSGKIRPIVDQVFSWHDVQQAHRRMEQNLNVGKIVLQMD